MYPQAAWRPEAHLLASVLDAVNGGNWQRSGRKNTPRPKPTPRPGDDRRVKVGSSFARADFDAVYARALEHVADRETAGESPWQSK